MSQDAYEQTNREFACDHRHRSLTYRVAVNGAHHYRVQCSRCGRNVETVMKADLSPRLRAEAVEFDEALERSWREKWQARFDELRQQRRDREDREWRERYERHLASPLWRDLRDRAMARDGRLCQGCRLRPALQVHHLTYERLGREMLFDLVSLCRQCHESIHGP